MNRIFILLLLALSAMGCVKELDLDSGDCFDVKKFLDSKNASGVKCGSPANFEGSKICLKGLIDITLDPETSLPIHIDLRGGKNYDVPINLIFDELLLEEVHKELHRNRGRIANIRAEIRGYDRPHQFNCTRGFEILVNHMGEITFE